MKIKQRLKRSMAFTLACILFISFLNVSAFAADSAKIFRRSNIFEGRTLTVFGKTHNSMGYYQEGLAVDAMPTFCLEPGKRMPNGSESTFKMYTASSDETIPGVGASDKFVPITLAYEWLQSGIMRDSVRYAVVQVYIWGCVEGYAEDWAVQEEAQRKLAGILGDNRVMTEYEDMRAFIENGLDEFNGSTNSGLPDWSGKMQQMFLVDGVFTLTLDISVCPQLKNTTWSFPDSNWSYQIAGESITFRYYGATKPSGEVKSSELTGVGNSLKFYAYIFTPGPESTYQRQVGRFANEELPTYASFYVTGDKIPGPEGIIFETHRHSEPFESHYNIDLKKYCAETNQHLEGTTFNIWEDFDASQLSGQNYHEGQPDGRTGRLYNNALEPLPSGRHICDTMTTDVNGYAAHRDVFSYNYSKTYCTGHPAPDWVEVPEPEEDEETGECTNEGEIEAAEAENERLYNLWTSQQETCEDTCDFHVGNEDEDNHDYDYSAQEEMLADRDETYEKFIALEYSYRLEEKTARTGYILHGRHGDDPEIETVTISAAENGGNAHRAAEISAAYGEGTPAESIGDRLLHKLVILSVKAPKMDLDDLRKVDDERTKVVLTASGSNAVVYYPHATSSNADLVYSVASDSEADSNLLLDDNYDDWNEDEYWDDYEEEIIPGHYRYTWNKVEQPRVRQASSSQAEVVESEPAEIPESWGPAFFRQPRHVYSDDTEMSDSFPEFMDDDLDGIETGAYGSAGEILYTFKVWDHRTEGEIHINKRDLELHKADPENSYGQTQGEATLEGAVYGLFAAQDLIHPDGKSGVIFSQNDLAAVAATDKNGDASFLAYTEKPGTRLDTDGNIDPPDIATGAGNLYNGSSITSSDLGFGTITYPDYSAENGNQWIGRPLLMGSYYVMELSRSEGYELSVNGIAATETNRDVTGITTVQESGQVSVSAGLSDNNNMDADGSWNDFTIENYKTVNGYDVVITGYPTGTKFYRMSVERVTETVQTITGSTLQPKKDEFGTPVYQTAKGGEYKTGPDGNPVIKEAADPAKPQAETVRYRFRLSGYPKGGAEPEDIDRWQEPVGDFDYLRDEVNGMLQRAGYKALTDDNGAPWYNLRLNGPANADAGTEILDWFTAHNAWDSAAIQEIYEDEADGTIYARLYYDYSKADEDYPAFYDALNQDLYIRKSMTVEGAAAESHYWVKYAKGDYSLGGSTAAVKLRQEIPGDVMVIFGEEIEPLIEGVYQPSYETYDPGETLLGPDGQPIPVMERVYTYADIEQAADKELQEPVTAAYDPKTGAYTIHVENTTDWTGVVEPEYTRYRAVTYQKTIEHKGETLYYNQYLVEVAGAGVSAYATIPEFNAGSYIVSKALVYPGQLTVFQDGGTRETPLQVLERVIKQSIRITKDISQASYDDVNTYGSIHNDPLTVLLELFNNGNPAQGTKLLNQFKFKVYLKANLEAIYINNAGEIISKECWNPDFKGDVQKVYIPPENAEGTQLLECNADGSYNYRKFFDALYAADQRRGIHADFILEKFAVEYYDVAARKEEVMEVKPGLKSDLAYRIAMEQIKNEAGAYLDIFTGLDDKLAIAWDNDAGGGSDGDRTTLQCNTKNGKDDYFNSSIMLPYGTYVIAEQTAADLGKELANRHYSKDYPKEVTLPFAPDISADGNTGEETVNSDYGNPCYFYHAADTPEDLIRKYHIRFNEETHIIQAHREDGDFLIYKYGLEPDTEPGTVRVERISQSENAGTMDGVVYNGNETASGEMEIRDGVPTMTGVNTAVDGKYAAMLVPWTILEPATDRINPDTGNVETLVPSGSGKDFNFVAYATEDFENKYYSSKLRIEKLDAETGENIIHSGALFKIYAAKREVEKVGTNAVSGSGKVLFGEAVDADGQVVRDNAGNKVLYPRVGKSNGSKDDLPIRLDQNQIPQYDESQLIVQEDRDGNETGIFKAYSTVREVVVNGQIRKETVGYIETYKPLGAGAYVLVEIQAPEGYTKSRPVAFEVYADGVNYYEDQRRADGTTDGWKRVPAMQYQYAVPVSGETNKFQTETVSQIKVQDYPSRIRIYKVEDGDSLVGNVNGVESTDQQGLTETSGGFDSKVAVNDEGDLLTYQVSGRKEYLEERGDVRDIAYDPETREWVGYVTKAFDKYSEEFVEGTENELKAMEHVKLLYQLDGTFTGKGIRFKTTVSDAVLALYKGVLLEKTGDHAYTGVSAVYEDGKAASIENTNTGTHKEIRVAGTDPGPAGLDIWDSVDVDNAPVNLFFYDLAVTDTKKDPATGELEILDTRGNAICYADSETGMAYVYDDYGRMMAYTVDEEGNKELVRSIQVSQNGDTETLYPGKTTVDDENGLPIYYEKGDAVLKDAQWTTDSSTAPDGTPETAGAVHEITRLPFGAYILQEEQPPYNQGYIQSKYMGLLLKDTEETQKYFLQDVFTKTAFAKIDVRTQREIQGAGMTLYKAKMDENGQALRDEAGNYMKGEMYASWISGTLYDDCGNQQLNSGNPIPTTEPHWIDHVPVGPYVLEETSCPYEQGYVPTASASIDVLETGNVQSFVMEDDFTSVDIRKYDTKNEDVLYQDSVAYLSLYAAYVDESGAPVTDEIGVPIYDPDDEIVTFRAAAYKDGQDVAATGRLVPDAAGNNPIMKYDYAYRPIPNTVQGRFCYTENGTVRFEYLPVGYYVLVEMENPEGYATALPQLMEVKDAGHLKEIQTVEMGDKPLRAEISKVNITGGKEVDGARMTIYPVGEDGTVQETPLVIHRPTENGEYQDIEATWISGNDGRYTAEDKLSGDIPEGFEVGDLKPHIVEYIPEGNYVLVEETTPYGFLQSVEIPFTIRDTQEIQRVEMADEIPDGVLKIIKSDTDDPELKLAGAIFKLTNKTTGRDCEQVTTNDQGEAAFSRQPIGYMDKDGNFAPYTYVCEEIQAAPGYMLTLKPYEFQFQYEDDQTAIIYVAYSPGNDSNRVKVDKVIGDTDKMLEGAHLQIQRWNETGAEPGQGAWEVADSWISTKQPHYSRGLKAGKYRLIEVETPGDGYPLLAEPIEFTIYDGMTQIPHLVMRNYTSAVEVEKTAGSSEQLLAGARLQLTRKADGAVIEEWVSQETGGRVFYGLREGTYIIHELEAPSGYRRAEDLEIQVQGIDHETQVFRFANFIKGSSGGNTPDTPRPDYITFLKTDVDHRPLAGAEFTFYRQDGTVLGTSVSDGRGVFRIRKPEDGTYIFRETKAPVGYTASQEVYSFTVSGGQVIKGAYEVVNHQIAVELKKADGVTGQGLSGARLRIISLPEGTSVYEGVTGEDGCLAFNPPRPGDYEIEELEAPEGYVRSDAVYRFNVSEDGKVTGNTTVYNFKAEKKIGRITVFYKAGKLEGGTFWDVPGSGWPELVKTGDSTPLTLIFLGLVLSLLGLTVCLWRKWGRKMLVFPAVLLIGLWLFCSTAEAGEMHMEIRSYTEVPGDFPETQVINGCRYRLKKVIQEEYKNVREEPREEPNEPHGYTPEKQIMRSADRASLSTEQKTCGVLSDPFTDSPKNHIPPQRIVHEGQDYALAAFETVPARVRGRTETVTCHRLYRNVESEARINAVLETESADPVTGARHPIVIPLRSKSLVREQWTDGFELEARVESYDGEMFLLGDSLVRLEQGKLPPETGAALLKEAGLDEASYEIHDIQWNGRPYRQDGILCRDLAASGRKKVADWSVTYEGEAALDEIDGQAVQAMYIREDPSIVQRPLLCQVAYYEKCASFEEITVALAALTAVVLAGIIGMMCLRAGTGRKGEGCEAGGA